MVEVFSAALPGLQQAVELAGNPGAPNEERLAAANDFSEALADLWPTLEANGEHVAEFLAFLDLAVGGLPEQAAQGEATAAVQVLELLALLEAHLEAPEEPEIPEALVEMATSESFDPPLSQEAAALWLDLVSAFERQDAALSDATQAPTLEEDASPPPRAQEGPQASEASEQAELGEEAAELLAILACAAEESREELLQRIDEIANATDAEVRTNAARAFQEVLVCLADASSEAGFLAFATLCASLGYQVAAMEADRPWPASLLERLARVPADLQTYLDDPLPEPKRRALVEILLDPSWPDPISDTNAEELTAELYLDPLSLEPEEGPTRATEIEVEDLSLSPAEDIDATVFASFRREGPELTLKLGNAVQSLLEGRGGEEALRQAQRLAHTIKGSANICGVRAIAVLGHHLEDLLEFLTARSIGPTPALGDALAAGADGLALMFDMIEGVEPPDPAGLRPILQEVLDWANRIDREGSAALAMDATESQPRAAPAVDAPPAPPRSETETDAAETYLQVPARAIDDLLRLVGELSMTLAQSEEQLSQAQHTRRASGEVDRQNLLQVAELEKLVDLRGLGSQLSGPSDASAEQAFDPLELEQYNEMYITTRRLNEGVSDARELAQTLDGTLHQMGEVIQHQVRLSRLIRQLAMGTRLVKVESAVARLQRAVRQTCRATGKEAGLSIEGGEAQIDGEVLDRLMPALMHLVRNAIDHGIEPPEQRVAAGKARQGQIEIRFGQSGDQIEIAFSDDGRGLDLGRIRTKAIVKGLIAADAELTDQELALLTLRPGFSTRDAVTQVSGRGVGMDVVTNIVRSLNGSLAIESGRGEGYRLRLHLPASRLTLYCLLIQCRDQQLAVPANEVRLAVLSDEGVIEESADGWLFRHEDGTYPLAHLNRLLGLPASEFGSERQVVLLVEGDTGEQALMVDALHEGRELVTMRLGARVPRIPGLMAASLLGDGSVIPIVELRTIMRVAAGTDLPALRTEETAEQAQLPTVLIADDSLSMRRALSQLVADAGYRPLTAMDGMDAIQVMHHDRVDLLLVDLEMPQMNGLELTAHLRTQPETSAIPIAMITSRSTEKHRREALQIGVDRYFVKPYRDEEVLDYLQQALEQVS